MNERASEVVVAERGETKRKRGRVGREPPETAGRQRRAEVFAGGGRSRGCQKQVGEEQMRSSTGDEHAGCMRMVGPGSWVVCLRKLKGGSLCQVFSLLEEAPTPACTTVEEVSPGLRTV